MKQEYEFRGKGIHNPSEEINGKWMYGDLQQDKDKNRSFISYYEYSTNEMAQKRRLNIYEVDPETVGQYVWEKDRNEKKIYTGDIVKMHYFFEDYDSVTLGAFENESEIVGVVGIDKLGVYTEDKDGKHYWHDYLQEPSEELEVIGNAYDNPEMLKSIMGYDTIRIEGHRGKRIDNDKWVYGKYITYGSNDGMSPSKSKGEVNIIQDEHGCLFEVDPETVGRGYQIRGIEIYEGDIIELYGGEHSQGYWEYDEIIIIENIEDPQNIREISEAENIAKLGNVFDNPGYAKLARNYQEKTRKEKESIER